MCRTLQFVVLVKVWHATSKKSVEWDTINEVNAQQQRYSSFARDGAMSTQQF